MLLLAVTLLTLLTCVSPVVHMMSTLLVIPLTIVAVHCNINGWLIAGMLTAMTSTAVIGSTHSYNMEQNLLHHDGYPRNVVCLLSVFVVIKILHKQNNLVVTLSGWLKDYIISSK